MIDVRLSGDDPSGFALMVHGLLKDNIERQAWARHLARFFRGCAILRAEDKDSSVDVLVRRDMEGILVMDLDVPDKCPVISASYDTWTELAAVPFWGPIPALWKGPTLRMLKQLLRKEIRLSGVMPFHLWKVLALLGMTTLSR